MLEAQPAEIDMSLDKPNINFRVDEVAKSEIYDRSDALGLSVSAYLREAEAFYSVCLSACPQIRELSIQRLSKDKDFVRNILVLLEKV